MKTFMATVASAALVFSLASGAAFAQAAAGGPVTPLTANDVLPADPFAGMDVAAAGATPDTIKGWGDALTEEQRAELGSRCNIIGENQANYQADATTFCTAYLSAYPSLTPSHDGGAALGVPPGVPMAPINPAPGAPAPAPAN